MLTDTQKSQVRMYLGYPDLFRYRHSRLEGAFDAISAEAETIVADLLTKLADIDTKMATSAVDAAGIKSVDEIEFFGNTSGNSVTGGLARVGRQYITRLSTLFGVPLFADYYGANGYPGDSYSAGLGEPNAGNGRGGPFSLG